MKKGFISLARKVLAATLLFTSGVVWGQNPCTTPPNCILNGTLATAGASGTDVNINATSTVNDWYISHGSPTLFPDRNGAAGNRSIWMWSANGEGEGIFTCYNFQQGQSYQICMWVRNTATQGNSTGTFNLEATNNISALSPSTTNVPILNPAAANREQINSISIFNLNWNFRTFTYTPTQNFNQLWIYPRRAGGAPQYEIQIDDIAITSIVPQNSLTLTASPASINWCGSTTLSLVGAPAGTTVSWSPATGLSSTTGLSVTASPCSTTTYTATATFNQPNCVTCGSYSYTYSVTVTVSPQPFSIVGNPNIICGDNLTLSASPALNCPGITYSWAGPNGLNLIGNGFSIPSPDSRAAGIYTLTVTNGCGGTVTQTVNVTYDCPCILRPQIQTRGCNPVTFNVSNSSLTNIVGWFWEFGDGNTSNLANPTHLYAQNGSYIVCVTVIGKSPRGEMCCTQICDTIQACGCSGAAPYYTWSPRGTNGANFTNASIANASVCGWLWDFGDGNTSTANNPSHQYAGPGTYTVCLIAYTCYPNPSTDAVDTCFSKYCQTITIGSGGGKRIANPETGSSENQDWEVKLFPNPASTELFVVLPEGINAQVRLLSADGKELLRLQNNGSNTYTANLKDIAPGMYLIEVLNNDKTTKRMQFVKE
jgi:PKD repeat protein